MLISHLLIKTLGIPDTSAKLYVLSSPLFTMPLFFPLTVYLSFADTKKSARELARDDLIRVLTYKSGDAVNWLIERFNLDLSKVSRLGGHSEKRTHRGTQQFPGMTITYALMEKVNLFVLCVIGLGADGGLALARGYGSTTP